MYLLESRQVKGPISCAAPMKCCTVLHAQTVLHPWCRLLYSCSSGSLTDYLGSDRGGISKIKMVRLSLGTHPTQV